MRKERVVVAMSGGVDSSVAAAVLAARGYDVVGVTMKLFCYGDSVPDRPCCSLDSIDDARRVCQTLGVPHYVLNLEQTFGHDVVADFVHEYARGRTPIPCVRCNTFTKFRDLVGKADTIDARWVATGHYARVADGALLRGVDHGKDQSYFLWGIRRDVLPRLLLPVGTLTKAETRARARELGLNVVADKRESQDILLRTRRRSRAVTGAPPRRRRASALPGANRGYGRTGGGRARRLCPVHGGPAARPPRGLSRSDVRGGHSRGRARGRDRYT